MDIKKYLLKRKLIAINHPKDSPTRCSLLLQTKTGEEWFGGWSSPRTQTLRKDEEIYLWLYEEEYNGKMYKKFDLPSIDHLLAMVIESKKENTQKQDVTMEEIDRAFGTA